MLHEEIALPPDVAVGSVTPAELLSAAKQLRRQNLDKFTLALARLTDEFDALSEGRGLYAVEVREVARASALELSQTHHAMSAIVEADTPDPKPALRADDIQAPLFKKSNGAPVGDPVEGAISSRVQSRNQGGVEGGQLEPQIPPPAQVSLGLVLCVAGIMALLFLFTLWAYL